jgi:cell division transport system permease protein
MTMAARQQKSKKKKKLGSYPFLSVIFSIMLSLIIVGLFGLILLLANNLSESIQSNVEMQVYLQKNVAENERRQIHKILAEKDYVLKVDQVPQIDFISKEEAAQRFLEDTGEDIVSFLGNNPLRDAYALKISLAFQNRENLQNVKKDVESMNGVYEATYVENLADSINANLTKISLVLLATFIVLLLAVIVLINNTIKLALVSQRFLIRSMQLVGAKSSFIRRPFLLRAFTHGLIGAIIAAMAIYGFIQYILRYWFEGIERLLQPQEILMLFGILLFMGSAIGYFSALRAIRKYLKLSLDELY